MFIDTAKIYIKAGNGGNGKVSFHREKYVAYGGPNGGDGGNGGNIVFKIDDNMSTLMDFRYKRKYIAESGEDGKAKNCAGKNGADLIINVPRGTLIKDAQSGKLIKDLSTDQSFIVAYGGRGGWGNTHFATPTRQAPRFAKGGTKGQELEVMLELKLIADVGLVGYPNVGKSTVLSMLSSAKPKIANYHFTTLEPNLGIVYIGEGQSFVLADIPGIIPGASDGAGLGLAFLRHIERCRLLVHVVDISGSEGRSPLNDFRVIKNELETYSAELDKKPQIIAANKMDMAELNKYEVEDFIEQTRLMGYKVIPISAATGEGMEQLKNAIAEELSKLPPVQVFESEQQVSEPDGRMTEEERQTRIRIENGKFYVEGDWIQELLKSINFDDYESRMYFERSLKKAGVYHLLREAGVENGSTVDIYGIEFDYVL